MARVFLKLDESCAAVAKAFENAYENEDIRRAAKVHPMNGAELRAQLALVAVKAYFDGERG